MDLAFDFRSSIQHNFILVSRLTDSIKTPILSLTNLRSYQNGILRVVRRGPDLSFPRYIGCYHYVAACPRLREPSDQPRPSFPDRPRQRCITESTPVFSLARPSLCPFPPLVRFSFSHPCVPPASVAPTTKTIASRSPLRASAASWLLVALSDTYLHSLCIR